MNSPSTTDEAENNRLVIRFDLQLPRQNGTEPRKQNTPPFCFRYGEFLVLWQQKTGKSTLTRIRTWNPALEAQCDDPFHYQGRKKCPARVELASPAWKAGAFAARPRTQVKDAAIQCRRSKTNLNACWARDRTKVDRRGVEPRFPACKTGVLPLDEQPLRDRQFRNHVLSIGTKMHSFPSNWQKLRIRESHTGLPSL